MADIRSISDFEDQIDALEITLGDAGNMTAAFGGELKQMQSTIADLNTDVNVLSGGISRGLRKVFDGLIFDGLRLSDALRTVAGSMVDSAYNAALKPVTDHVGGLLGGLVGGVMNGVSPFGSGASGFGAAAAPAMPQARPSASNQGNQAGPVNLTMNISTPDVEGFQRSQSQIAAQMGRALSRGQRHR